MTEQELANVIWDIKEIIRNLYDDAEVEDVILPFTLLRRLDCVLDGKRDAVIAEIKDIEDPKARRIKMDYVMKKQGLPFFNTSGLSLEKLLASPNEIGSAFGTYLDGFTDNVKDILANFVHTNSKSDDKDLSPIYERLERHDKLFAIVQLFVQRADLHPDKVSNAMMGTVFEIVIRRSKESTNTKAGQFYTPRDVVRLLVSLVMCGQEKKLYQPNRHFTIYDPCCGTGGMLTVGREYMQELSGRQDMKVYLYGQELNEKTYAICKSDLLIKGDDQNLDRQIFRGDTLGDDMLLGKTFDFMLANPPFGVDWGKDERVKKKVQDDNCPGGRFEAGLPFSNDGSMLFLQHMISKMDDDKGSRIGIVLNGSPLFNGNAGSGWSNIRKMLLDRDLLDAIVALPGDMFYGTNITTYLWILDNKRPAERNRKVLFINAAHAEFTKLLQTNLGKKRYEVSNSGAADILAMYKAYTDATREIVYPKTGETETLEVARLLDYDDFLYTIVAVRRPLRLWYENITERFAALCESGVDFTNSKNKLYKKVAEVEGIDERRSDYDFFKLLDDKKVKTTENQRKQLRATYGTIAEDAPIVWHTPLKPNEKWEPDANLNDTEKIPMKEDIDEYFEREVLPFAPDAMMDRTKDKVGCEFPFNRIFYKYRPLRSKFEIMSDLQKLDSEIGNELANLNIEG